jgi:hypothetical protein
VLCARLRKKLDEMEIVAPFGFWERVELREGNVFHHYARHEWKNHGEF